MGALKISWSCCIQRRNKGLTWREESSVVTMWGGGHRKAPSTNWNTLSKKIELHLHSPIKIIDVCKLQRDNMLSVRKRNNCRNRSLHGSSSHGSSSRHDNSSRWVQKKGRSRGLHRWWRRKRLRVVNGSGSNKSRVHWREENFFLTCLRFWYQIENNKSFN